MKLSTSKHKHVNKKILLLAVILALLYFVSLHPISGFLGGALFLLVGWLIPSLVNLLLSYSIAYVFIKNNIPLRLVICIIISALLGLNILLMNIINKKNNYTISVVYPLYMPTTDVFTVFSDYSTANIKPFPINLYYLAGDEGCGCLYFKSQMPLYNDLATVNALEKFFNHSDRHIVGSMTGGPILADYVVQTRVVEKLNKANVQVKITDKFGGEVLISKNYPTSALIHTKEGQPKYTVFPGKHFWRHAGIMFIYNNFWVYYFKHYFETPSIYDALQDKNYK
jgi:hypothetical protein